MAGKTKGKTTLKRKKKVLKDDYTVPHIIQIVTVVGNYQKAPNHRMTLQIFQKRKQSACFNPFVPNAPFLYPLKTSENLTVFLFLGGRESMHWEQMS